MRDLPTTPPAETATVRRIGDMEEEWRREAWDALMRGEGYPPRPKVLEPWQVQPRRNTAGDWIALAGVVVLVAFAILVFIVGPALALDVGEVEPIKPRAVYVVDGDTIRAGGFSYRLVGFDTPETGSRAECESEVAKGYEAKARVVALVRSGQPLALERAACSCPPNAAEGSTACNYGRRCGTLRVSGEDVGAILMREGLAKPYTYRWSHGPPKPRWCSQR